MMRATGAKLRMLASEAAAGFEDLGRVECEGEELECGEADDMARLLVRLLKLLRLRLQGSFNVQRRFGRQARQARDVGGMRASSYGGIVHKSEGRAEV